VRCESCTSGMAELSRTSTAAASHVHVFIKISTVQCNKHHSAAEYQKLSCNRILGYIVHMPAQLSLLRRKTLYEHAMRCDF
jgi:hypothetical protein